LFNVALNAVTTTDVFQTAAVFVMAQTTPERKNADMIPILLIILLAIGAVVVIIALTGVGIYNRMVQLRQMVKNAWAQIDVQLKRRHDLIPNLVNTVKGYAAHERGTLDDVISARAKATSATLPADRIKAEGELSGALGRLLAVSEAYPNLKANENFMGLQNELRGTEDRIAFSRQTYNDSVTQFNTSIQTFPAVLLAGFFGFKEEPFFETPAVEKEAPKVDFGA
jgi:LemA protein